MKFLVQATHGPSFASPEEAAHVLKTFVLPTFDKILEWESAGILKGGLPVGERALAFIIDADSCDSLDAMLRGLPLWTLLEWTVTPLTGFTARGAYEKQVVKDLS
jgi:hypothetical protein